MNQKQTMTKVRKCLREVRGALSRYDYDDALSPALHACNLLRVPAHLPVPTQSILENVAVDPPTARSVGELAAQVCNLANPDTDPEATWQKNIQVEITESTDEIEEYLTSNPEQALAAALSLAVAALPFSTASVEEGIAAVRAAEGDFDKMQRSARVLAIAVLTMYPELWDRLRLGPVERVG